MPESDMDRFLSRIEKLIPAINSANPGHEASSLVEELAHAICTADLKEELPTAHRTVEDLSLTLQTKVIGTEWKSFFKNPIGTDIQPQSIRLTLELLWIVGGPMAISSFFENSLSPLKGCSDKTILSFVNALVKLDPTELSSQFHLPLVVDNLVPAFPLNYEIVIPSLLSVFHLGGETIQSPVNCAIILIYASRSLTSDLEIESSLKCLRICAKSVLSAPKDLLATVFDAVAKSSFSFSIFEPVIESDDFANALAITQSTSLLESFCSKEKKIEESLELLFKADLLYPSKTWSGFITTYFGSHNEAYGVLHGYLLKSKSLAEPKKSLRTIAAIASLIQSAEASKDRSDQTQSLQIKLLHEYPRLINYGQGHDAAIVANDDTITFSRDIEEEMKLCFQRMYEQHHDIQEIISMLEKLKQSDIPRDQDLFACMIHSLFDEYQFFPQYPVKALASTAVLFGSLIHFRLVEGVPLSIALKFILDALRQDTDSNMFRFGLQALVELRQRLPEFPKYCKVLLSIPGLQKQQHFYSQIKRIADPDSSDEKLYQFKSINATQQKDEPVSPSGDSVKKVLLIVNNLTSKTLSEKTQDVIRELDVIGHLQFSKILVTRAISEPNYHYIYAELIDLLPEEVRVCCINEIVSRVSDILNATDALGSDKRLSLKNLGQILGMITIARDKPLLFQQMNLKLLLGESVRFEKLPAVLPFVAKLLAQSANSKVFCTTSPWIQSILKVLSELYKFGSLKLTMKFEIEVLGKTLNINIPALQQTYYIRDEAKQQEDAAAIAATLGGPTVSTNLFVSGGQAMQPQAVQQQFGSAMSRTVPPGIGQSTGPPGLLNVPATSGKVVFGRGSTPVSVVGSSSPSLGGVPTTSSSVAPGIPLSGTTDFITHPNLRQLLDLARSKTLQDVLLPVIDRAVSIASFTAKELVLKDLAREPDEVMLQAAAHSQALVLASSMAIVTAKEPFIEALGLNLRSLMAAQGYGDAQILLDQVGIAAREAMESLIPLIESVAREKVITEVDEALLPSYQERQLARARKVPFVPENWAEPPLALPELLAVRRDGVLPEQMSIYDHFTQQTSITLDSANINGAQTMQGKLQQLSEDISRLEASTKDSQKRLGDLNKDDETLASLSELVNLAREGAKFSEELPLRSSHIVVQSLFGAESTNSVLFRECLCYTLGELCRMSALTAKEVVLWLLYSDDIKKYNYKVIGTLLRSRLVTPTEIDASLNKDLADLTNKPIVLDYAVHLLLDALIGPDPYCLRSDFACTILAISRLDVQKYPAARILMNSLQETKGEGSGNEAHVFAEWTRLMQHHATAVSPLLLHAFVRDLHSLGWGADLEQLTKFVRASISVSVESYLQSKSFVGIDAIATLVSTVLSTIKRSEEAARTIFTIITMLVAQSHESENFDALPYYRLLSSTACTLPPQYVGVFAEHLLLLQPIAFPGFASCWMSLMSHRFILGRMLANRVHWPSLFQFTKALVLFIRHVWLSPAGDTSVKTFVYRGVERICLVILHDAPEFFVRYANETTALLLFEFVQLRNLVLCAFPEGVSLPHPVEMNEADYVDVHEGVVEAIAESKAFLTERKVIKLIENACAQRPQLTPQIVLTIQTSLAYSKPQEDRGVDFNTVSVSMLGYNSLCTYVAYLYTLSPPSSGKIEDSGAAQFCARMLLTLSKENRYAFVSAIANHLRYPEKHTYFFSRLLLALFTTFGERMFKEGTVDARHVITRVLLERLMAHRAHPWGLMATFAQLLKSKQYNFWDMPFIKSSPELSDLFSTLYAHISQADVHA